MSVRVTEDAANILDLPETPAVARKSGFAFLARDLRLLIVALWLGAALFFSFAVAPSAFTVLRASSALYANHLAGSIVTRTLAVVNTSGFIIGLLLVASAFGWRDFGRKRFVFLLEIVSLLLMTAATGVGQWVIAARMLALRLQMGGPIDETAATDPLRVEFNSLHGLSVSALGIAMLAALAAFIAISRRARSDRSEVRD